MKLGIVISSRPLSLLILLLIGLALVPPAGSASATIGGNQADAVWGQPDFRSSTCQVSQPTGNAFCTPRAAVLDAQGNLWVADFSRVLLFPFDTSLGHPSTTPARVFGQVGSFTTNGCNQTAPGVPDYLATAQANTLCRPGGLAVDGTGTLYVADTDNNRVLVYVHASAKPSDPAADLVLGQPDFTSFAPNDTPPGGTSPYTCSAPNPASECTLNHPTGVRVDAQGDLLVADSYNNRVLLWRASLLAQVPPGSCATSCYIPASQSWGQHGSFSSNGVNGGPAPSCSAAPSLVSPTGLNCPGDALADGHGDLFIADSGNNRVLEYDHTLSTGSQAATMVYGQNGSFSSNASNLGGLSVSSLHYPAGLAFDPAGNFWVADELNSRVLQFPPPDTARVAATVAVGGLGAWRSGVTPTGMCSTSGIDAGALCDPATVAFDQQGDADLADPTANRVLEYTRDTAATGSSPASATSTPLPARPTATPPPNPQPEPSTASFRLVGVRLQTSARADWSLRTPSLVTVRPRQRITLAIYFSVTRLSGPSAITLRWDVRRGRRVVTQRVTRVAAAQAGRYWAGWRRAFSQPGSYLLRGSVSIDTVERTHSVTFRVTAQ